MLTRLLARARTRRPGRRVDTLARAPPPRFGDPKEAALSEAIDVRVEPLLQADRPARGPAGPGRSAAQNTRGPTGPSAQASARACAHASPPPPRVRVCVCPRVRHRVCPREHVFIARTFAPETHPESYIGRTGGERCSCASSGIIGSGDSCSSPGILILLYSVLNSCSPVHCLRRPVPPRAACPVPHAQAPADPSPCAGPAVSVRRPARRAPADPPSREALSAGPWGGGVAVLRLRQGSSALKWRLYPRHSRLGSWAAVTSPITPLHTPLGQQRRCRRCDGVTASTVAAEAADLSPRPPSPHRSSPAAASSPARLRPGRRDLDRAVGGGGGRHAALPAVAAPPITHRRHRRRYGGGGPGQAGSGRAGTQSNRFPTLDGP